MPRRSNKSPVDGSFRRVTRSMTGKSQPKKTSLKEISEIYDSEDESLHLPKRRSKRIFMKKQQVKYDEYSSDDDLLPKRRPVRGWTPPKRTSNRRATKRKLKANELDEEKRCTKKPKTAKDIEFLEILDEEKTCTEKPKTAKDLEFLEILDDEPPQLSPQPPIATLMKIKKDEINKFEKLRKEQAAQVPTMKAIKAEGQKVEPGSSKSGNLREKKEADKNKTKRKKKKPKPLEEEESSEGEDLGTLIPWACPSATDKMKKVKESSETSQIQRKINRSATPSYDQKEPPGQPLPISRSPTEDLELLRARARGSQILRRVDTTPVKIVPKDYRTLEDEDLKSLESEGEDGEDSIRNSHVYKSIVNIIRNSMFNPSILTPEKEKLFRKVLYKLKKDGGELRESPLEGVDQSVQTDPEEKKQTRDQEVQVQGTETEKVDQESQYESTVVDEETQTICKEFCYVDDETQTECTEVIRLDEFVQTDLESLEEKGTQTYSSGICAVDKATQYDPMNLVEQATEYDKVIVVEQATQTDCQQEEEQSQTDLTIQIDADVQVVPNVSCVDQETQLEVECSTQATQTDSPVKTAKPIPLLLVEISTQTSPVAIREVATVEETNNALNNGVSDILLQKEIQSAPEGNRSPQREDVIELTPEKQSKTEQVFADSTNGLHTALCDYKTRLLEKVQKCKQNESITRYSKLVDTTQPYFPVLSCRRKAEIIMPPKRFFGNSGGRTEITLNLNASNIINAAEGSLEIIQQTNSSSSETEASEFFVRENHKVTSTPEPKKPCIAITRLNKKQTRMVEKLKKKGLASYSEDMTNEVTHLIVDVDENNCLKSQTLKYLKAVAAGIWILRSEWVQNSLRSNLMLPEGRYEVLSDSGIDGPKRSRLRKFLPSILSEYSIYVPHKFQKLSKREARSMIELVGGTVEHKLRSMKKRAGSKICVIVAEDQSPGAVTIYEDWMKTYGILTVDLEWLLQSISRYQPEPVRRHLLIEEECLSEEVKNNYAKEFIFTG